MSRMHLALAAALLALTASACASPSMRAPDEARWLRIDVIDRDSGEVLPQHRHRRTAWVAGADGQPYTLRLQNLSGERVLVVLSVDGVNVVTGETASPAQSGYVLAPWGSAEVDGWRKSMQEVAAFRFSRAGASYAARTARPFDLGVIGAAVFREARRLPEPWPMPGPPVASSERRPGDRAESQAAGALGSEARRRGGNAAESLADAAAPSASPSPLGTAHGERRWSPTTRTHFKRASAQPDELVGLRYDRHDALVARGVIRGWTEPGWAHRPPRAFPGGFVPDP